MANIFPVDAEPLIAAMSHIFTDQGSAREVAVLANSEAEITQTGYDNWNGGTYEYCLHLQIPYRIYAQLSNDREACEGTILEQARVILRPYPNHWLGSVLITPTLAADKDWRERANAWLVGEGVSNQGRVRSDNIPSRACDGLLFRSEPEICLYRALKNLGVSFAPLPVFVRGGSDYRRIEPDFVILKNGVVLIVEVDGDTVHHETPAEAHARTAMLVHEGAHVERVKASDCATPELAISCARRIIQVIEKLKAVR